MASGADDVLEAAQVFPDLASAIAPCSLVLGASARTRRLDVVCHSARECVTDIIEHQGEEIAIVFGSEHSGLTNEELNLCHVHLHIPTVATFSSLNLSQAVQVVCYEVFAGLQEYKLPQVANSEEVATVSDLEGLQHHFVDVMNQVEFLNPDQPKKLVTRLRRLIYKANLEATEVNILRGFLAAVQKQTD